jgi:hypothetical protein
MRPRALALVRRQVEALREGRRVATVVKQG